jgi:cyclohexa-1,5-dienecarbonyl-CoA hydratase
MSAPVSVAFDRNHTRAAFTLYHPKGNIITAEMIDALTAALSPLNDYPHLKLITIEGTGHDFSFGASIPEHTAEQIGAVLPRMHRLVRDLLDAPAVTAALVRGRCLGGGFELALACDFMFAADDAIFGLPEIALGVFPPAAAALLPFKVGGARALRAILTGELRSAADWHRDGLVELIAPSASLEERTTHWFEQHLASKSAVALRHGAAAARAGLADHVDRTLPQLERLYLDSLMRTQDAGEGVSAFLEKRTPRWTDR